MNVCEALMRDGRERRARFEAAQAADKAAAISDAAQSVRTVADIPDAELLGRVVRSITRKRPRRQEFAWVAVMEAFGLGSTYAAQLCTRYGIDPDTGADLNTPNVNSTTAPE